MKAAAQSKAGRIGDGVDALGDELARVADLFARAGAVRIAPATLQPADLLLGLYGEDIRARAFITHDPVDGELVLRPDFTAPVARMHIEGGRAEARYRYQGHVWRRQEPGSSRPTEYMQAGVEFLGAPDPVAADAEVFGLIREALGGAAVTALTGDLSIALSAIDTLPLPERRRAALRRHLWRPERFRRLLESFGEKPAPSPRRAALLAAARAGDEALRAHVAAAGAAQGVRGADDISARARELAEDDASPPLARGRVDWLESVLAVSGPAQAALSALRRLDEGGALSPALDRFERRLEALAHGGADPAALMFDASFGRALEYYDGFVFEFRSAMPGLPPLGGGGRYDALTARLGGGAPLPAVGGIVRPEAAMAARLGRVMGGGVRLGLPSKGRLRDDAVAWFGARGLTILPASDREYAGRVEGAEGVELVLLAAGEAPRELAQGRLHLAVTGEDMIREKIPGWEAKVALAAPLGFGRADLVIAAPSAWADVETVDDLDAVAGRIRALTGRPLRIATKYHVLIRRFLKERGVADYRLVDSQGATEGVVRNGVADAVADITSTGDTLRANHLRPLTDGLVLRSEATLCRSLTAPVTQRQVEVLRQLGRRLGVAALETAPAGQ